MLHAAYNDSRGVTAAFNVNLLTRLNRELDADFDARLLRARGALRRAAGAHRDAPREHESQTVGVAGVPIRFRKGEYIVSEHSHKYAPQEFAELAQAAGWTLARRWIDDDARFSLSYFRTQ